MWTEQRIRHLLQTNNEAVERALLVLLDRQTYDEQQAEDTKHRNDRGFTQADAPRMTSMAMQVRRGYHLTPRQLGWLRNGKSTRFPSRIGKYHRQLLEQIELKARAKVQSELALAPAA